MKYLVVVEHGKHGWGAHVPDLPGCVAAGKTREDVLRFVREAIAFHIEALHAAGEAVPIPTSEGELIEVDAA